MITDKDWYSLLQLQFRFCFFAQGCFNSNLPFLVSSKHCTNSCRDLRSVPVVAFIASSLIWGQMTTVTRFLISFLNTEISFTSPFQHKTRPLDSFPGNKGNKPCVGKSNRLIQWLHVLLVFTQQLCFIHSYQSNNPMQSSLIKKICYYKRAWARPFEERLREPLVDGKGEECWEKSSKINNIEYKIWENNA